MNNENHKESASVTSSQNTPSVFSALKNLIHLFSKEEKKRWGIMTGFALCTSLFEIVTATAIVVFAQVLNDPKAAEHYIHKLGFMKEIHQGQAILYIALFIGGIYLIKNCIAGVEIFFQNFSIQKMNYRFKNKLLKRYGTMSYAHYLTRNSSLGMQVVGSDTDRLFSIGMTSIATILSESIVFISLTVMIIYMNPSLALIIFGIGSIFGFLMTRWILPLFYRWGKHLQESALLAHQNLSQFFHAFKEIVLLGKCHSFIQAYEGHSRKLSRIQALQTASNGMPRIVIEVLFISLFVTAIAFLSLEHENSSHIMGVLGSYFYAGFRLMPGLNRILNQINSFKAIIPSIERVYGEYNENSHHQHYKNCPHFTFNQGISLKNICFRYENTQRDALQNVTFEIKKGESIGIVGETGSGKSTLVDLILGLLTSSSGEILIDHRYPTTTLQWHEKIGYVPQSIYLIDHTIEANIAFGEEKIDPSRLSHAINAAQLTKFIDKLPNGLKTIVGERGVRLSGGERQRISIARALYRNPDVLIFDEATSALDNATEARLMETIRNISRNHTVIMIAHRLTTLKECDRIIKIDNGRIVSIINQKKMDGRGGSEIEECI